MSQTVDQRVVEMRFDNKQFESAIADTQKTVKTFNKNLNKEFGDSNKDLDRLGDTADAVRIKFNALDMLKFEALHRVFDALISKGEQLVKAFTIDQVSAGWQKYADKTEAVQTIMNATGKSIEDVEEQLDKLNWFADETSYSFIDMTSNVGKFTAAGVELETAVTAMQGISTWAALSGANVEQASRAMYNLSQAMGMGSVRVQDWMSIENANMATKEFKEMAIQAAIEAETLKKDLDGIVYAPNTKNGVDVTAENFRSTLSEGWFTSDVLLKVLDMYGKATDVLSEMQALSGVDTTSELLNVVEAYNNAADALEKEKIFTEFINDQDLQDDAAAVEELRKQFELLADDEYTLALRAFRAAQEAKTFQEAINATKDAVSTKWMNVFQDIFGSYEEAKKLWTDVSNILWDIFAGPIDNLHEATKRWSKNGGLQDVHSIITGILQSISDVWQAIRDTINLIRYGTTDADEVAEKKAARFLEITGFIRKGVEKLQEFVNSEPFQNSLLAIGKVLQSVAGVAKSAWKVLKTIFGAIKDAISNFIQMINFKNLFEQDENGWLKLKKDPKKISFISVFDWIREKLDEFANWLSSSKVLDFISKHVGKFVGFLLELPGKINSGFKKLTGSTIGETLKKFWNKIKEGFQWLIDNKVFQNIWDGIKSFFSAIGEFLKSLAGVETYGELFDKIKAFVVKIFSKVKEFFGLIVSMIKGSSGEEKNAEKAITEENSILRTVFDAIKEFTATLIVASTKALKNIDFKSIFGSVVNLVQALFSGIASIIKATDWKQLLASFIGVSQLIKAINRVRLTKAVADIAVGIKWFGEGVEAIGVAAKKAAKGFNRSALAALFTSIAFLIITITAVIYIISKKMSTDDLVKGIIFLIGIFVAIKILINSISNMKIKTGKILAISMVFIALGIAMTIIASVIKKLSSLDSEKMINATLAVVAVLSVMVLLVAALMIISNYAKPKKLGAVSALFLVLGITMLLMVSAIKRLADINPDRLVDSTLALLSITVVMAALIAALMVISSYAKPKKLGSVAALFLILGVTMLAVVAAIKVLSKMDPDRMMTSALTMLAIISVLTLMVAALMIISNKAKPKNFATIAAVMLGIAAACLILAMSMRLIASMDSKAIKKAGLVMALFAVGLVLIIAILSKIKISTLAKVSLALIAASSSLLILTLALYALYPAIALIAAVKVNTLLKVGITLVALFAILAIGGRVIKGAIPGLLGLSAVLLLISAAAVLFAVAFSIMSDQLLIFTTGFIYLCQNIVENSDIIIDAFNAIAEGIANSLIIMATYAGDIVKAFFDSISEVLTSISNFVVAALKSVCNIIIEAAPSIMQALSTLLISLIDLAIDLVPKIIELFVALLNGVADNIEPIMDAIMRILIGIIDSVASNIDPLIASVANLLISLFNSLTDYIPKITEGLTNLLFTIVDSTLGAILRGVFESFGSALATFAEAAKPFFEALKGIDPDVLNAVAALGTMMIAITASAVIDGISKFLSFGKDSPLVSFGKQLAEFAPYLMSFANSIRGINAEQVEAAANAGKMLSEMYNNLPKSGGLLQQFFGESMNLEEFGKQLKQFANGFVAFYKVIEPISPIDQALVESAAKAGKTLAGLYNALPKSGGVMQKFFGESMSLKEFGSQLVDFAYGFVGFYNVIKEVSPIDQSIVDGATRAGKALAGLYNNLPKSGGVMQKIFGETMSLKDFGQDLVDFAKGFVNFYREITKETIDQKIVRFVTDAALSLAGLYNNMPKKGGLLASFFGETMSLKDFGDDLVDFAKGFNSFYTEITKQTIDEGIITTVTTSGQALAALYTALPKENNIFQDIFGGGQVDLKDFGTQLTYFGEGFTKFYNALPSSIDEGLIKAATNAGETIAGLYDKLPKDATGFFQDVFGSKHVDLADFGDQLKKFGEGFSDFYEALPTEVNQDIVNAAATAGETMAGLYKSINESGITKSGWIQSIFGKKTVDLGDFGDQLAQFGSGFKGFYEEVKGLSVNQDLVTSISNAGLSLVGLYTALTPSGGFWEDVQKLTGKSKDKTIEGMGTVATEVGGILKKINEMYTNGDISATNTSFFAASATNLIQVFKDLTAGTGIKADKIKSTLSTAVTAIVEAFSTDLTSKTTGIPKSGTDAAKEVLNSFESRINPNTNNAAKMSLNSSVSSVVEYFTGTLKNSLTTKLADIGTWVAAGLEAGLSSEEATQSVYNAGYSVANAVEQGVRNKLMVQSPSKVMIDIGKYVSEGLAIGIKDYAYKATDEATDMGFETIDAVSQAISKSKDILGSNLDDGSLVITPVLDLSEIQNGAAIISQMMQNASGDTFGGTFDYANRTAASRQAADIYDPSVVSLDKLSGAIEELLRNPQGISNNFTINSNADPKEIAEEVSKIIQTQVERRQAVWAR